MGPGGPGSPIRLGTSRTRSDYALVGVHYQPCESEASITSLRPFPETGRALGRSLRRCRERCTRTFSTKLGDLITNGYGYTTLPSIIREFAFRQVRTLGSLLWRQVALQLPRVLGPARTEDPNASSAASITSESSGHSSGTWKQRSSTRSLCDYLVIDGPLQGQWANGGCAASRRISLHMRADQPVPRVARTRAQHSCSGLVSGRPLGT